jgi:hypothetical protein
LVAKSIGFELNETSIVWSGSSDFEHWTVLSAKNKSYELNYELFVQNEMNDTYYIKLEAESTDGTAYTNWATIMAV